MAKNWSQYEKQVMQIYSEEYERTKARNKEYQIYYDWSTKRENSLHNTAYCAILFWEGAFDSVFKYGMSAKKALGWSSTFMKEGLALFLLLLYNGNVLPKGLSAMLERAVMACGFHAEAYLNGIEMDVDKNDQDFFWDLFCKWKTEVDVSEKEAARWMGKIEQLISMRVAGIMEANRRNYYGECAAFIAAFGEVRESQGIWNAKAAVMDGYKTAYPRRRAFHQELRAYGMMK